MADVYHNGQKIGYTNKQGQFVPVSGGQSQNNYQAQPAQQQPAQYKSSGAVYSKIKDGEYAGLTVVNAWKTTKFGMLTCSVTPNWKKAEDLVISQGKSGQQHIEYTKMIATVMNKAMGTKTVYPCLMNNKTKVIVLNDLSMCITPNGSGTTKKGKRVTGYFGKNFKS
jgi:hypothetical protein